MVQKDQDWIHSIVSLNYARSCRNCLVWKDSKYCLTSVYVTVIKRVQINMNCFSWSSQYSCRVHFKRNVQYSGPAVDMTGNYLNDGWRNRKVACLQTWELNTRTLSLSLSLLSFSLQHINSKVQFNLIYIVSLLAWNIRGILCGWVGSVLPHWELISKSAVFIL